MLHPEADFILKAAMLSDLPPLNEMPPDEARVGYRRGRNMLQSAAPQVAATRDLAAGTGVQLREYRPAGTKDTDVLAALVYYHGGGWVIGDLDSHDVMCRVLANESGCAVYAVDYRLAPEHPFPIPLDDCLDATRWIFDNADSLQVDPARIAIGGDSAGGNIAAVIAIKLRDSAGPQPVLQLLLYPATDFAHTGKSIAENGTGYMLTSDLMNYFEGHYLGDADISNPDISPIQAADLSGLPGALVITAGFDPLRDEGLAYADALSAAGVSTSYVCFDRMIHGFATMNGALGEANVALSLCAAELRRATAAPAVSQG